jgi:hypothetical protein
MEITIGNWEVLKFSCDLPDDLNLSGADEITIQMKTPAGIIALSKTIGHGVTVNTPTEDDIQLEILSNDYTGFDIVGKYPIAAEIDWGNNKKQEIGLTEDGKKLTYINVKAEQIV